MRPRDVIYVASTTRERKLAVVAAVAEQHGVALSDVMSRSRKQPVAMARQAAMRAIASQFGESLPVIGRLFDRDHTTVLHALQKVAA